MGTQNPERHTPLQAAIPGYDFGAASVQSPISIEELRHLEASCGWTDEDVKILERYRHIFLNRAEEMVDSWRAVIASQPHLAQWFVGPDGQPDDTYKSKVKARFVQWVRKHACALMIRTG